MSYEIVFPYATAAKTTLTATLRSGATVVASGIALSDTGRPGLYLGSVPNATADGDYGITVYDASLLIGASPLPLRWRSGVEVQAALQSDVSAIGDPFTKPVPGTYPAGSAGAALGRLVVPGNPEDPVIVIPAAPNDVSTCRVYGYVEGPDNRRIVNAKVKVVLLPRDTAVASNRLIAGREVLLCTNSEGRIMGPSGDPWVDLQRNDLLLPAGSFYEVTSVELGVSRKQVTLTTSLADLRALLLAP
jgi:hypothetical protein